VRIAQQTLYALKRDRRDSKYRTPPNKALPGKECLVSCAVNISGQQMAICCRPQSFSKFLSDLFAPWKICGLLGLYECRQD